MNNVQVIVLAGGIGRRTWPIKKNKNLLPFFGQTLISHQIKSLKAAGFKDLIIVAGPGIKDLIKTKEKIVVQKKPLGQADAILTAEKELKDAPLLVVNANDFFHQSLFKKLKEKMNSDGDALLVGLKVKKYFPGGYLVIKNNWVKGVVEKPGEGKEPSNVVRLVVDYFKKPKLLFQYLKQQKAKQDGYERAMDKMIKDGLKFGLVRYCNSWATIKYPWDILQTVKFFLENKKKEGVVLERGVKVFEGAVIRNSYIGRNVVVGNNALIRDSIIEEGCVIGYNTEIARSYVGPNCWFHANYIGDSVLEGNVSFGSGAKTANLRLDEKEIIVKRDESRISTKRVKLGAIIGRNGRVGINASIMPGVLIGANSFVGPGLVLKDNLEENKFCYLEEKIIVKNNLRRTSLEERERFKKEI